MCITLDIESYNNRQDLAAVLTGSPRAIEEIDIRLKRIRMARITRIVKERVDSKDNEDGK